MQRNMPSNYNMFLSFDSQNIHLLLEVPPDYSVLDGLTLDPDLFHFKQHTFSLNVNLRDSLLSHLKQP
jgi:hypothetical protein